MDLISIIVPVYKVEKYLDNCIESIVNQTYKNLEIILVDDGSPDSCPKMCDDWAKNDDRIRVIHKENGGLSDARNAGLKIATGEYIGFVDSDDCIAEEMYEKLLNAIIEDESDIAACDIEMIFDDRSKNVVMTPKIRLVLNGSEAEEAIITEKILKQPVWYKLYKKSVINNIMFEFGKLHEDVFWSYQVIGNANKVSIIDYVGYFYYQRLNSIMGENYSLKRLDEVEAKVQRQRYLMNKFPDLVDLAGKDLWLACIFHGQAVLDNLKKEEKIIAFKYLNNVQKKNPIRFKFLKKDKFTHKIWWILSKISLKLVCNVRNNLGIYP